jgi:hypothetical protein
MPASSTCRNCGRGKTPAFYEEPYCSDCTDAIIKSREAATKAGTDVGAAKREALANLAHTVHNNRPNPRTPMSRADYWNAQFPTGAESDPQS